MKVKVLKGKRKKYKGIVTIFLFVVLTNVIGAFAKQKVKIANLSKKIFEIEKKELYKFCKNLIFSDFIFLFLNQRFIQKYR